MDISKVYDTMQKCLASTNIRTKTFYECGHGTQASCLEVVESHIEGCAVLTILHAQLEAKDAMFPKQP